jgi:translation initiation factor IF-3
LLRVARDLEDYGKVEQLPQLEGKKMAIIMAPKKAGVAKKSQQKVDREKREAEAKEAAIQAEAEKSKMPPAGGGLFDNAKISEEALKKLTGGDDE